MKKTLTFIIFLFAASLSRAATLSYQADLTATHLDQVSLADICEFPLNFSMDSKDPLAPTFLETYFGRDLLSLENIQATAGNISGGGLAASYSGDYREKVYYAKVGSRVYKPFIAQRAQVTTYGDVNAPSGFVVNIEILNHKYSAEIAEGSNCGDVYYKLVN